MTAAISAEVFFAAIDYVLEEVVLVGGIVVGPLLASIRLGRRAVAWVTAIGVVLAGAVAAVEPGMDDVDQRVVSLGVAVVGSALALYLTTVREERERAARRLAAQHGVARVAADAPTLEEAAPRMLTALADTLGWNVVGLWEVDGEALRQVAVWHSPDLDPAVVRGITGGSDLRPGEGLPGRVWKSGRAAWILDVTTPVAGLAREVEAAGAGLRSAFAFPTRAGDRVVGVIEFFTRDRRGVDGDLLSLMSAVGGQVGQYIEVKRAQQAVADSQAALRRSRDELDVTLGSLADGVTVQNATGRLVYANQAAADTLGFATPQDLVATPVKEVAAAFDLFDEAGRPLALERLPGRRALAGEDPEPLVVRFRMRATGAESWSIVKSTPVRDADGRTVRAVNIFEDISEQKRIEIGQRFLADAGRLLGASLNYATTLRSVADVAVPSFADWCAVYMTADDGSLEPVAVAHADPEKLERVEEILERWPPDPDAAVGSAKVMRTGRSELWPQIGEELLQQAARDEAHLSMIRSVGFRSAMIVPLPAWRGTLGVMAFINSQTARSFDKHDLALAEEVGRRAATAIENARLYRERTHIARTLQDSLLPPHLPEIAGLDIAARYRAAGEGNEVGGDFYDLFDTGDARWGVLIGDVCGKGADAAAITALARYTLRAAAMRERRPSRVLELLNEALLRQRADRQFCTVAYASVDVGAHGAELIMSCGGHPPPMVLRGGGGVEFAPCGGTLLGVVDDPELSEAAVSLSPGDAVVLYTDGVTEARTPEGFFGSDRLAAVAARSADRSAAEIARRIEEAAASGELRDDVAIVVLRVPDVRNGQSLRPAARVLPQSGEILDVRLPATAEAIRTARHAVERLEGSFDTAHLDDLRLLVSELVTNAIRHASLGSEDWIGLRVERSGGALRTEVSDPGPGFEAAVRDSGEDGTGGWGLYLVDRIAARWGVDRNDRTTVWFEIG